MMLVSNFVKGIISVITVTAAPQLYRYPYRNSIEAFRGDMQRIGGDLAAVNRKLEPRKQRKSKNHFSE